MNAFLLRLWRKLKHFFRIQTQISLKMVVGPDKSVKLIKSELATDKLVTVVIPALNEEKTIEAVVQYAFRDKATGEVIVVDDYSTDRTAIIAQQAGAKVITSSMLGKGASMQDGVMAASHEFIVFLDGDLSGLQDNIISDMAAPLGAGPGRLR